MYQIEPVGASSPPVDESCLKKYGIISKAEDLPAIRDLGVVSSTGNVMKVAQVACGFKLEGNNEPGVFLAQHNRCEDEIIGICNDLIYSGRLEPKKKSNRRPDSLPPLVYCHVNGQSARSGTSRYNELELNTIIGWLQHNQFKIEKIYGDEGKNIADIVGVVTPFYAQAKRIKASLPAQLKGITIGTVHSLQGAEREIVIFSTVYTRDISARMLNDKPNLINVAVSRAKECFMVFGDTKILDSDASNYAGILGQHMFKNGVDLRKLDGWNNL